MARYRRRIHTVFLTLVGVFALIEGIILFPAILDGDAQSPNSAVDPKLLISNREPSLAPGIPHERLAEYHIEKFDYVSVQNGQKLWRIQAEEAFLYNAERLTHSKMITADLYDPEGQITHVTGLEAKYFLNHKDLEIYGNVKTHFPDGFTLESEYLRYQPNQKLIQIPKKYLAHGSGKQSDEQTFRFTSQGLDYFMGEARIQLLQDVKVMLEKPAKDSASSLGIPDQTTIESDHCLILRNENHATFTMDPKRKASTRFIHIIQPTLFVRARKAILNYGDFSKVLQYLTAYDDVIIKETGKSGEEMRYATGQKADFDTRQDQILLTGFPQVYQGGDTVTGDFVLMHRNSEIIEIGHSNAFSEGKNERTETDSDTKSKEPLQKLSR